MSDAKISALPSAATLTGAERLPVSQSNQTRGATAAQLLSSSLFTQTGTGAIARSINSKFGDIVSVKDFGAVGDGVTDDTAAIQAAITYLRSLGGGVLFFSPGSYKLNTALDLSNAAGITIQGAGANVSPQASQADLGVTSLLLNTGGVGIDMTGSNWIRLQNIHLHVLNSYSNPSKVCVLMARSATITSAQFNNFENLSIYTESAPAATARGRVGIYNVCAEHWVMKNCFIRADQPLLPATTDVLGVPSPYQGALYASTTTFFNFSNVAFITNVNGRFPIEAFGSVSQVDMFNPYFSSAGAAPTAGAININNASNIWNIHDMEIEGLPYVMNMSANIDGLHITGQIATYGAATPLPYIQLGAANLVLARGFLKIRQNDGARQLVVQNSSNFTVTDSIVYLGTSAGFVGPKVNGTLFLADDATSSVVTPAASSDYLLLGNVGPVFGAPIASPIPVTETNAARTVLVTDADIICNRAGTVTLTLLAAATYPGRVLRVRTIQAQTVISAGSNVVPLIGGAAGTAILAATAGKWADLKSDGSNWQIMAAN